MCVRQVQRLYGQVVQNRPQPQKVGREHLGMVPGRRCVSSSSLQRTPHRYAKIRYTANSKPASVTPPTQLAPGDYPVRHEIFALHLTGFETIHPERKSTLVVLPTGYPQLNRLLPRRIRSQRPTHLRSERVLAHALCPVGPCQTSPCLRI